MTRSRASSAVPPRSARFNGVKVFTATTLTHRSVLDERVTQWLAEHRGIEVADIVVVQSSDARFHCLTICVFFSE